MAALGPGAGWWKRYARREVDMALGIVGCEEWEPKVGERVEVRFERLGGKWEPGIVEANVLAEDGKTPRTKVRLTADRSWYSDLHEAGNIRPLAAADEWEAVQREVRELLAPRYVALHGKPGSYAAAWDGGEASVHESTPLALLAAVREKLALNKAPAAPPVFKETAASLHWNGTCALCGSRTWSGLGGMPAEHDGACRPKEPHVLLVGVDLAVGEKPVEPFYMLGGFPGRFATKSAALAWWERNR